jgi:hypothetical protein
MKEAYKEFAERFAQTIVDEDFDAAHKFFAPWLQAAMPAAEFRAVLENRLREMNEIWEIEELIFPDRFAIDGNSSDLAGLREASDWRAPRKISDAVTNENFRQWLVIQFMPDETDARVEFDAWFDFWLILVETDGALRIGFFELEDAD